MNILQLRETLRNAEKAYAKAKTSLDNSNELIMAREELKHCRYAFDKACRKYTLENLFGEFVDDE